MHAVVWLLVQAFFPLGASATGQKQPLGQAKPKIDLSSPYAAVQTHFSLLDSHKESYNQKIAEVFVGGAMHPSRHKRLAVQLKKLLVRKGVRIATIPQDPNYVDPASNACRYTLTSKLPQVYLVKSGGEWRYSQETSAFISKYKKPLELYKFCYLFLSKEWCQKKLLDIAVWQYLVFLGLVCMIWVLHRLMPYFFAHVVYKFVKGVPRKQFSIERLLFVLLAIWLSRVVLPMLHLERLETLVSRFLEATTTFLCMCLFFECVGVLQEKIKTHYQGNKFTLHMLPLYSMVVKILIILYGLIKVIDNFGFATQSIVQVLSFSTLGLGLASQDIIKNLFGSFMIIMDRPFGVGDDIEAGAIRGKVEEIGLRATLLRTKAGSLVYIPNAKLADAFIDNFGKRTMRMIALEIPLGYNVPLGDLTQFIRGLRGMAKRQPFIKSDKTSLHLDKMTENGLVIAFELFLDTTRVEIEKECKQNIISFILKLAQHLGIELGKVQHVVQARTPDVDPDRLDATPFTRQDIEKLLQETKEG